MTPLDGGYDPPSDLAATAEPGWAWIGRFGRWTRRRLTDLLRRAVTVEVLIWTAGVGISLGVTAALGFLWQSRDSQTIALATAALVGAAVWYGLQLAYELRPQTEKSEFRYEVGYSKARESLVLPNSAARTSRKDYYYGQSHALIVYGGYQTLELDQERLTADAAIGDLLLFFDRLAPDWQFGLLHSYNLGKAGTYVYGTSREGEYREYGYGEVVAMAEAEGLQMSPGATVRLPPRTKLSMGSHWLALKNSFGELRFDVHLADGVAYRDGKGEPVNYDDTTAVAIRAVVVTTTNTRNGRYRHHVDAEKYARWRSWVVANAKDWLTAAPSEISEAAGRVSAPVGRE